MAVTSTFSARGHWQAKVGLKVMIGSSSVRAAPARRRCRGAGAAHWRHAIRPPTTSIRTANAASSTGSGTWAEALAPATAPPMATSPKATPRPSSTLPARCAVTAPTREVTPTTTSDPVVACAGLWPST